MKNTIYRCAIHPDGRRLRNVGILADGTIHNPNGYNEHEVREAVLAALDREKVRRQSAAKKAVKTRAHRREQRVRRIATLITAGAFCPNDRCAVCGRLLTDPESTAEGIGPECAADVLRAVAEEARA